MIVRSGKNLLLYTLILLSLSFFLFTCGGPEDLLPPELAEQVGPLREALSLEMEENKDYSGYTINYFKPSEVDMSRFPVDESDDPLEVVDFGPVEELPVEMNRPTIYVAFSQPIVPLSKLGEPMKSSPVMTVEPKIPGIFRWYGSRILSFEPADRMLAQREFVVTVSGETSSLGGKLLGEDFRFSFHSEYLDIVTFYPGVPGSGEYVDLDDVPPDIAKKITIVFSYPVNLDVIKNYLQVSCKGEEYPFTASRPKNPDNQLSENFLSRTIVMSLRDTFPERSIVSITLLEGARSEEDYLGRPSKIIKTLRTLKQFRFEKHRTRSYSFPRSSTGDSNPVFLEFSHPIDEESLKEQLSISLDAPDLMEHITVWRDIVKLNNLPVSYNSTFEIILGGGIRDIWGRSLGVDRKITIEIGDAYSYYYFPNRGTRMLEAEFEPKIIYEYQNIFDGVWKVAGIEDPFRSFNESELEPYDFSTLERNKKHFEVLDLSPWLNESGKGFVGLSWNFSKKKADGSRGRYSQNNLQLMVTDLGITTRYAYNKVLVWVNSLSSGSPVSGAEVRIKRLNNLKRGGITDETGLCVIDLAPGEYRSFFRDSRKDLIQIEVQYQDDHVEFRPNRSHNVYRQGIYSTSSPIRIEDRKIQTFMFTDRGLYKPGETITFRGIDRTLSAGSYSVYEGPYSIEIKEAVYRSKPFLELDGETTESGGFYGTITLPEDLEPGFYNLRYSRENLSTSINFQVAFFRRAAFEVTIPQPTEQFYLGEEISLQVTAEYLAGGRLGSGEYRYFWMKEPARFKPSGEEWKSLVFGPSQWGHRRTLSQDSGTLSPTGQAQLKQKTTTEGVLGLAYRYSLEVRVEDPSRQEISNSQSKLVHPARFYIGAKLKGGAEGWWSTFLSTKTEGTLEYSLVKPDGKIYESTISDFGVQLIKLSWKVAQQRGVYGSLNTRYELVEEILEEDPLSVKNGRGTYSFTPEDPGRYVLRLSGKDSDGRTAVTDLQFYATGAGWVKWAADDSQSITLLPEQEIYQPGETARILIQSPLPEGRYLLTIEREGIFSERIIELDSPTKLIEVPITENFAPVVYIALSSFTKREVQPSSYYEPDLGKPKGYFGIVPLSVSLEKKSLSVEIKPDKEHYLPGERATYTIRVSQNDVPLPNAEVTFLAVDRGVLDLIDYHIPDPIKFFYDSDKFPLAVYGADSRSLLIDPVTYEVKDLQGGDTEEGKLPRRKDFTPLAVFEPFAVTDGNGEVRITFNFPDTLTTYRATAIVLKGNHFGRGEDEVKVQNPINIRTALPRRLRVRDSAHAGVIVTNLSAKPQEVQVTLSTTNILVDGENRKTVLVEPGEAVEVPFLLAATGEGEALLTFEIRSALLSEVLEESLIVERARVNEAFTVTGSTNNALPDDSGLTFMEKPGDIRMALEGFLIPQAIQQGYGGLTLQLNSTMLPAISGAVTYLLEYPYYYLDNRLTRILPVILFGENLAVISAAGKSFYRSGMVDEFFSSLKKYQNGNGGFSHLPEHYFTISSPYLSVKIAHYLSLAKTAGYDVEGSFNLSKLLSYLYSVTNDKLVSRHTKLYAVYVLSLWERDVSGKIEAFLEEGDVIGMSGYGFLALSLNASGDNRGAKKILTRMKNFIKIGTRSIDFVETYERQHYFDSSVERLSLLSLVYRNLDPDSEMNRKILNTLDAQEKNGYWVNTSDTAWAVIAYANVMSEEAAEETDLDVTVLLDEVNLHEGSFAGPLPDMVTIELPLGESPLADLPRNALLPLSFYKNGRGTVYYNATFRYSLPSEIVPARDEGFSLFGEILDLDGNRIAEDELTAGTTYRMRMHISTSKSRTQVVLRIPVPSGADILDASFKTTGSYADADGVRSRQWQRELSWGEEETYVGEGYAHISPFGIFLFPIEPVMRIYDNEVQYFFDSFYPGSQTIDFLFRAVIPGLFPTPPAIAECMYEPEVFGRTAGILYVIR